MAAPGEPDYSHTLSVNKDDLTYFADQEITGFIADMTGNPGYQAMQRYSGATGGSGDTLLVGNQYFAADSIVLEFKRWATGVATDLSTLNAQMSTARIKLKLALDIMETAHEEAMTAAEMMAVLTKVSTATAPKSS
ncbi:hypothetical protein AB0O91_27915 [Kitasatospora sp. NPDC089797]|uniref:hypothetical protein n=1 Tax=Kitasatospora sp. NPDC089797 TaxID=3155298 RepID=UPI003435FBF1